MAQGTATRVSAAIREAQPASARAGGGLRSLLFSIGDGMFLLTVGVVVAGFRIINIESAYLDIVLAIRATKDAPRKNHTRHAAPRVPQGLTPTLAVR